MVDAMSRRAGVAAILALAAALCASAAPAATAKRISFETGGEGELVTVTAFADMEADPRTVWNVISDYDHLADFIPDMRSSRVIRRDGDQVLIEQTGELSFLIFRQPIEVRLAVTESPPRRIVAHAVSGSFKSLEGRYTVENLSGGDVRLSYSGRVVPDFQVPAFVGRMVVSNTMARQFDALVKEIVRRDTSGPGQAR